VFEARLYVIKIGITNDLHFAHVMPMVDFVMIVIADYPAMILVLQAVINIRQIVASDLSICVGPNFVAQETIPALPGYRKSLIDDFLVSHAPA
jgi:hypothetical protein